MIAAAGGALLAVIALGLGGVGLVLAKRVVNTVPRPRRLQLTFRDSTVTLPQNEHTTAPGKYLLRLAGEDATLIRVGEVLGVRQGTVCRALTDGAETGRTGTAEGYWSAHRFASPEEVGECRAVTVPLRNGEGRDAWLFSGNAAHWVVHVQGIRTSRSVTLRSVAAASAVGATSLAITYRGAGDGPPSRAATLGAQEWTELRDAIAYARLNGARRVTVAAWSMGAALMLELLKHDPAIVDDLILMCPVSSWPATIEYGAVRAGLPRSAARLAGLLLRSRLCSAVLGMSEPIDVRLLDWTFPGSLSVPTLIIHSRGDEVVPWESTIQLMNNNAEAATLVETAACPHGFELTAPDRKVDNRLHEWLISDSHT